MLLLIISFVFILGLIIGSFLNCLIWRLHTGESMMGRSHCPKCKKDIPWYDNVPVLSYILLLGKCRHCQKKISFQYPLVEFITGVLFVIAFIVELKIPTALLDSSEIYLSQFLIVVRAWFVIAVMVIVFIYDLRWYLILDRVMVPAMIVILFLNTWLAFLGENPWDSLWKMLFSTIIGGGFFLMQFLISRGKWIGGGDIRLGFLMGITLSWPMIIEALMLAYIVGSIVGIFMILLGKKKWGSKLPFGVFLSTATIVVLFWGQIIFDWYSRLLY